MLEKFLKALQTIAQELRMIRMILEKEYGSVMIIHSEEDDE